MSSGLLLVVFVLLMLVGLPIWVSLGLSSMIYLLLHDTLPLLTMIKAMTEGLDSFTLLAIPFFILAGMIMNESGMTTRIFKFARSIVGYLPGGLGHVNVVTSIIFAGMSGSAIADAGGTGSMEAKAMMENGYDAEFSIGLTAASSLIGPIIPPSIPMLVYGVIASTSVAKLFAGGILPGLLMGGSLMIMVHIISTRRKYPRDLDFSFRRVVRTALDAFWGLFAPVILLGGIFGGIVTPTEGAVIAIVYSLIIGGFVYRGLTWKKLGSILLDACESTVSVALILSTAAIFAWILAYEGTPQQIASFLLSITQNPTVICLIIVGIMLFVGCFMEAGAAMVILLPVILPVADSVGVDRVHLGLVVVLTLMIGLLTPPVGLVLFVLGRSMNVPVSKVIRGTMPFLIPLVIAAILVAVFPQISLWIPSLLGL
jgi:tripartite ATP-independent transporter DctM subunit